MGHCDAFHSDHHLLSTSLFLVYLQNVKAVSRKVGGGGVGGGSFNKIRGHYCPPTTSAAAERGFISTFSPIRTVNEAGDTPGA